MTITDLNRHKVICDEHCPPSVLVGDSGDEVESKLIDALRLFDALTLDEQEHYLEEARRQLPASLHNEKNLILLTALRLKMNKQSSSKKE